MEIEELLSATKLVLSLVLPTIFNGFCGAIAYYIKDFAYVMRLSAVIALSQIAFQLIAPFVRETWVEWIPIQLLDPKSSILLLMSIAMCGIGLAPPFSALFGSNAYYKYHNIATFKQAVIAAIIPAQVYYRPTPNHRFKFAKAFIKNCVILTIGRFLATQLYAHQTVIEAFENSHWLLHMEAVCFLFAFCGSGCNVVSMGIAMIVSGNDDFDVDPPYHYAYAVVSPRQFWQNWSKPTGEMLRYGIYYPLGGRKRPFLSVPIMFFCNAIFHFELSRNTYGHSYARDWMSAFLVFGIAVGAQVWTESQTGVKKEFWWVGLWFIIVHISNTLATSFVHDTAFQVGLRPVCNALLLGSGLFIPPKSLN